MLTDVANAILKGFSPIQFHQNQRYYLLSLFFAHYFKAGRLLGGKGDFANCPLMWEWHKKKYWGAAHGAVGILFLLLGWIIKERERERIFNLQVEIYDEVIKPMGSKATNEIQDTIDFLLTYYWKGIRIVYDYYNTFLLY